MEMFEIEEMVDDLAANSYNSMVDGEDVEQNRKNFETAVHLKRELSKDKEAETQKTDDESKEKRQERNFYIKTGVELLIGVGAFVVPGIITLIKMNKESKDNSILLDKQVQLTENAMKLCIAAQENGHLAAIKDTTAVQKLYDMVMKK